MADFSFINPGKCCSKETFKLSQLPKNKSSSKMISLSDFKVRKQYEGKEIKFIKQFEFCLCPKIELKTSNKKCWNSIFYMLF